MKNELSDIRGRIIDKVIIIVAIFIILPLALFTHRIIASGWSHIYFFHYTIALIVFLLAFFRTRIPSKVKVYYVAAFFGFTSILSLYVNALYGVYFFVLIGLALLVVSEGIKSSIILATIYLGLFGIIAYAHVNGLIASSIDSVKINSLYSWTAILLVLLVSIIIIIYGIGAFYHELITIIKKKEVIENELICHKNNLEVLVNQRTSELEKTSKSLTESNELIHKQNSELKLTLSNLKDAQSRLLQSEKMASLGVLTAGVAHEINNPLNYIIGAYEGLRMHHEENKSCKHNNEVSLFMSALKEGVDRASGIVQGLGQFSRENNISNEECNIHDIIENTLTMLHYKIKDRISIVKKFETASGTLNGNVGNLHQVILNILSNSIDAIEEQGNIGISTKESDGKLLIEIKDDGIGISKENISRLTDPFFTLKAPGKGTGLGLSITYNIIQEHKGSLDFESEPGSGTVVKVGLPI